MVYGVKESVDILLEYFEVKVISFVGFMFIVCYVYVKVV